MGHARKERVFVFGTDQRITSGPAVKRPRLKAGYMTAPERFADCQIPLAPRAVAVGTEITLRPPHRTRRALLTHRAPTLDGDEEPLLWPRMQDAWEWQVPVRDRLHTGPRQSAPLAAADEGAVPAFDHVMPKCRDR
jgi:hypothetical protein